MSTWWQLIKVDYQKVCQTLDLIAFERKLCAIHRLCITYQALLLLWESSVTHLPFILRFFRAGSMSFLLHFISISISIFISLFPMLASHIGSLTLSFFALFLVFIHSLFEYFPSPATLLCMYVCVCTCSILRKIYIYILKCVTLKCSVSHPRRWPKRKVLQWSSFTWATKTHLNQSSWML